VNAARLRGSGLVLVSLAVHALAIVGVSALAVRAPISPLFVDLTQEGAAGSDSPTGGIPAVSTPEAAGGGATVRRSAPETSRARTPIRDAPSRREATARSSDTSAAPPADAAPATAPPAAIPPAPSVPEDAGNRAAPSPPATVEPAPARADAADAPSSSAAGQPAGAPAAGSGPTRAGGAASEPGGTGTGPGMSAPGGARLVLTLPGAAGRGDIPAEYGPFLARFRRSVEDALVYPLAARRQGLAGRVELDVLLEPGGRVTGVEVHASSSHVVLDEAGIAAVRSLPLMPLPEGLPRRPLRIRLPLEFQLR
jgi:TonB family protein